MYSRQILTNQVEQCIDPPTVHRFIDGAASDLADNTKLYYAKSLARMSRALGDDAPATYSELTESHIQVFIDDLEEVKSRKSYMGNVRRFLSHLNEQGEGPGDDVAEAIRPAKKKRFRGLKDRQIELPGVYTEQELRGIMAACVSIRDQAFFMTLYATGARASEIVNLSVGDVEVKNHAVRMQDGTEKAVAKMKVRIRESKTMPRTVGPMQLGARELQQWLDARQGCRVCTGKDLDRKPDPNCPRCRGTGTVEISQDDPLWITRLPQKGSVNPCTYHTMNKIWHKYVKPNYRRETGRDLKGSMHWLRHTRLTDLARHMSAAELCQFAGWIQGSDVVRRYVNASGRGFAQNGLARAEGEVGEATTDMSFLVNQCPSCGFEATVGSTYCPRCGAPLTEKAEREEGDAVTEASDVIQQLVQRIEALEAAKK